MDYQVPSSELVQIVRWQAWFWRSWREIILGTGLINGVLVMVTISGIDISLIDPFLFYVVLGGLIALGLGFWVSVFTTIGLYKRQIKRDKTFWFCLYYAIGAAIMALGFGSLVPFWELWSLIPPWFGQEYFGFRLGLLEVHMLNFIVANALAGWRMQSWLKQTGH